MSAPAHVQALKDRLAPGPDGRRRLISAPGCWDAFSALLIEQAGFEAAFLTGSGVSMARLARPDIGLVTATELTDTVSMIRDRIEIPLLADADTGFGNEDNARRTVKALERAGASAIQIEDQTFPKRCGHMAGKDVIPLAEAADKIKAALDARDHALIIARTDALSVRGPEDAFARAQAFIELGADLVFVEGPRTPQEGQDLAHRFASAAPLVYNLVKEPDGPEPDEAALEALGFAVALHPLLLLGGFAKAAPGWLATLKADRSARALKAATHSLHTLIKITEGAPPAAA